MSCGHCYGCTRCGTFLFGCCGEPLAPSLPKRLPNAGNGITARARLHCQAESCSLRPSIVLRPCCVPPLKPLFLHAGGAAALSARPHRDSGGCGGSGPGRPLCAEGHLDPCEGSCPHAGCLLAIAAKTNRPCVRPVLLSRGVICTAAAFHGSAAPSGNPFPCRLCSCGG